jgi:hypothetical protein
VKTASGPLGRAGPAAAPAATLITAQGPFSFPALLPLAFAGRGNAKGVLRPAWWTLVTLLAIGFVAASLPAGPRGSRRWTRPCSTSRPGAVEFSVLSWPAPFGPRRTATGVIGALVVAAFALAIGSAAWRRTDRDRVAAMGVLALFSMLVAVRPRPGPGPAKRLRVCVTTRDTHERILFG